MSDEKESQKPTRESESTTAEGKLDQAHVNAIVTKETAELKAELKRLREAEKELAALKEQQLSEQERTVKVAIDAKAKELEESYRRKEADIKVEHAILIELHRRGLDPRYLHLVRGVGGTIETPEDAVAAVEVALKDLPVASQQQQNANAQGPNRGQARKMSTSGSAPIMRSQLRDRAFWAANRDRCMEAIRNGEVVED